MHIGLVTRDGSSTPLYKVFSWWLSGICLLLGIYVNLKGPAKGISSS